MRSPEENPHNIYGNPLVEGRPEATLQNVLSDLEHKIDVYGCVEDVPKDFVSGLLVSLKQIHSTVADALHKLS